MREAIEQRIAQLRDELQRADDEVSKLRPRLQYLEAIMQRLDGALTALQGVLDDEKQRPVPHAVNSMAQPVAS